MYVKNGNLSFSEAYKKFQVSRTTLRRHLAGEVNRKPGRRFLLTARDEATIVRKVRRRIDQGCTTGNVFQLVKQICREMFKENNIGEAPSRAWFHLFMKRNHHAIYNRQQAC